MRTVNGKCTVFTKCFTHCYKELRMEPVTFSSLEWPQGPLTFRHLDRNKSESVISVSLCDIKVDLSVIRPQAGLSSNKWLTVMTRPVKPCPICYFIVKNHKSTISQSRAWFPGWMAMTSDLLLLKKKKKTTAESTEERGKNVNNVS